MISYFINKTAVLKDGPNLYSHVKVPDMLQKLGLRTNSYPFDWTNPGFVLYLLLQALVREHFFVNSFKCWCKKLEHYVKQDNTRYNVDKSRIEKYIRRFERLKSVILNHNRRLTN